MNKKEKLKIRYNRINNLIELNVPKVILKNETLMLLEAAFSLGQEMRGERFPHEILNQLFSFEDNKATAQLNLKNKEENFKIQFDSVEDYIFVCSLEM